MDRREFLMTPAGLMLAVGPAPTAKTELCYRQVHLDFHTSEQVKEIGRDFDPEEFVRTLKQARVNSITCFARCHHGWMYYDTKKNPERRHPHLTRNLLKEQIEICHKNDIRVPIYTTIQWDHFTAQRELDWLVLDEKGAPVGTPIFEAGFYRRLCYNSPYRQFIEGHVKEICETLPVDGFFFDIVHDTACACLTCRELMRKQGLNPALAADRQRFARTTMIAWQSELSAVVRRYHKQATIFYNAGHIGPLHRVMAESFTHWELESLPSGGWGYLDFPLKARYTRTLGMASLGMTGKFHTSWGDFHSLKNQAALQFECFQMLALGAQCSVGDQLHPAGRIDRATYDLIGSVYREVEQKEPWCAGAAPLADIGVITPEEFVGLGQGAAREIPPAGLGAVRMLTELGCQFDILDSKSDVSKYKVLILPDRIPVDIGMKAKIDAFLAAGGALLASYASGLSPEGDRFALDALGLEYVGEAPFSPDFLVMRGPLAEGLPATELVMYQQGKQVKTRPGAEVLIETNVPYFNRTWDHFFSHRHTPSAGRVGYPGVVQKGRCIYFMHPVFTQYHANAPLWVKRLVRNALGRLLAEPLVQMKAPSSTIAALSSQPAQNRWVLHLLHYIPERRGTAFDVIEDVIPLADLALKVRTGRAVKAVRTVPQGGELVARQEGAYTVFTLPKLLGHQMIELSF